MILDISAVDLGIGIVAFLVTVTFSFLAYRRLRGEKGQKIINARREVVRILANQFADSEDELKVSAVEAILNSKYRNCNVKSLNTTEFPIIIEDLITQFAENIFLLEEKRESLIDRASNLQRNFERRKLGLKVANQNWQESSILKIALKITSTFLLSLGAGLFVIILAIAFNISVIYNLIELIILLFIVAAFSSFMQYRVLKEERGRNSHFLHNALEDTVTTTFRDKTPNASFESNVLTPDGRLVKVDLVITLNEEKIPVEIKHKPITVTTINNLSNAMGVLKSKKAILVTSSRVGGEFKELANSKNIIILESMTSEEDVIRGLSDTKFFE